MNVKFLLGGETKFWRGKSQVFTTSVSIPAYVVYPFKLVLRLKAIANLGTILVAEFINKMVKFTTNKLEVISTHKIIVVAIITIAYVKKKYMPYIICIHCICE